MSDRYEQEARATRELSRMYQEQARAEIERLRAALTHIMELGCHSLDPDVDKRMTELAREALE